MQKGKQSSEFRNQEVNFGGMKIMLYRYTTILCIEWIHVLYLVTYTLFVIFSCVFTICKLHIIMNIYTNEWIGQIQIFERTLDLRYIVFDISINTSMPARIALHVHVCDVPYL